jgi:hypothetical protein
MARDQRGGLQSILERIVKWPCSLPPFFVFFLAKAACQKLPTAGRDFIGIAIAGGGLISGANSGFTICSIQFSNLIRH